MSQVMMPEILEVGDQETLLSSVLLIDDQQIIGESIGALLKDQSDIQFTFCQDPTEAITIAEQVRPTVILQDLVMPDVDGLTLVRYFRANPATKNIPMIVLSTKEDANIKAEAFALGANDYLVKVPDKEELIARIRYHSKSYTHLLQRNEAYDKLRQSQEVLLGELNEAAQYVRSLLPPLLSGKVNTAWEYLPSEQLGGDAFGYRWLDEDHFALYLLDVCGHGIGAALLSITLLNFLQSKGINGCDFHDPKHVLTCLNRNFPMEKHHNMFFTMWYGVWNQKTRQLTFSSGGHPPAILLHGKSDDALEVTRLSTKGFVIGGLEDSVYENKSCQVEECNQLYLFSDGVYEINKTETEMMSYDEFVEVAAKRGQESSDALARIVEDMRQIAGGRRFEDDFCLMQLSFS